MEDERWDLQVQAAMEDGEKVLQVGMEDVELQMEIGSYSGQFGCRKEEGRSQMEERDKSKMEEWMEEMDEWKQMEDFDESRCVLGTGVEGPDGGWGPSSIVSHHRFPFYYERLPQLPTQSPLLPPWSPTSPH